jgi:4-hydroxy-2-oxoheptanedioate aldolase
MGGDFFWPQVSFMARAHLTRQGSSTPGKSYFGFLQTHPHPGLTELVGISGYDFILLDGEHGLFTDHDYVHALRALESSNVTRLIRVRGHDMHSIGHYLDLGADGIVVPGVSTEEQARALVRAMSYPPDGTRGFAASLHRSTRYGADVQAHLKDPAGGASLFVILESALGAANADKIIAVDGVDGIIIGPFDLAAEVGHPADFTQPAFLEAVHRIESACAAHPKLLGTAPFPGAPIPALFERGHRLFIIGADMPLLREALSSQLRSARSLLGPPPS